MEVIDIRDKRVAAAFNEWTRRYIEDPKKFQSEWETIRVFLEQSARGVEPDAGAECAAYLVKLITES
jgi:hypothetical protein